MSCRALRIPVQLLLSVEQSEGAGARVRRSIGRSELKNVDPFLMLDEFKVGLPAGFPDHPHRGFETVTYVLPSSKGKMTHEDSNGHAGTIGPGDLQWMTAAKGILHSEVPESREICHGLQLWINLPKSEKMMKPQYQEIPQTDLAQAQTDGVRAVVIAGTALNTTSQVKTRIPVHYSHFSMDDGAEVEQALPEEFTVFVYTLAGVADFGNGPVEAHTTITFSDGGGIKVKAISGGVSFVILGAKPIGEPVAKHGPFVMNTHQEIQEAIRDYQSGRNGFERADTWKSKNQLKMG